MRTPCMNARALPCRRPRARYNGPPTDAGNTMATPRELDDKLWEALKSDRTVMLGLDGVEGGHARPMTAQFEEPRGPIWFFTAKDSALVKELERGGGAHASFVAKDHDLFASLGGELRMDMDRAVIDRLWNPF